MRVVAVMAIVGLVGLMSCGSADAGPRNDPRGRWWCTDPKNPAHNGVCERDKAGCDDLRHRFDEMGSPHFECRWRERVACYVFHAKVAGKKAIWCSPSIKECRSSRDYMIKEQKEDVTVLTNCEIWDQKRTE
jgi:hypothetical protein